MCLMKTEEGFVVRKKFRQRTDFLREQNIYQMLSGTDLPHAEIVDIGDQVIRMLPIPGKNMVEILEIQENTGRIDWRVWDGLVEWLLAFADLTGCVMMDVNLRNFLYDEVEQRIYGLDFEECMEGDILTVPPKLAAYIRNYVPEQTWIKKKIADHILRLFSGRLSADLQEMHVQTAVQEILLQERRKIK